MKPPTMNQQPENLNTKPNINMLNIQKSNNTGLPLASITKLSKPLRLTLQFENINSLENTEYTKLIFNEAQRFCSTLSAANVEISPYDFLSLELKHQINELLQTSFVNTPVRIERV